MDTPILERDIASPGDTALLRVRDLRTHFPIHRGLLSRVTGYVRAVDGVSFDVMRGRSLGLVGESGCGKTTVGRTILRLITATSGEVTFDGVNLFDLRRRELRNMRKRMQIIFQDPVGSLNPRMTAGAIVAEPLKVHRVARGRVLRDRVATLFEQVGLNPTMASRYPHEFSGGQRQRIGIARAIALRPRFIVCDEPVSALDVSIQAQILNLLSDLQEEYGLTYLFIAHNLAVVKHFCDDVAVMYLGRIVETAPIEELFASPKHPYTQALIAAVPEPDPRNRNRRGLLRGEVPSPADPPTGCAFHPRCPFATDRCRTEVPKMRTPDKCSDRHRVACHHADDDLDFATAATSADNP